MSEIVEQSTAAGPALERRLKRLGLTGDEDGWTDRYLLCEHVVDPGTARSRQRFEGIARFINLGAEPFVQRALRREGDLRRLPSAARGLRTFPRQTGDCGTAGSGQRRRPTGRPARSELNGPPPACLNDRYLFVGITPRASRCSGWKTTPMRPCASVAERLASSWSCSWTRNAGTPGTASSRR